MDLRGSVESLMENLKRYQRQYAVWRFQSAIARVTRAMEVEMGTVDHRRTDVSVEPASNLLVMRFGNGSSA